MTGFGKAEGIIGNKKISIQLKSLNSKLTDISVKLPSLFKEQELRFRKQLSDNLSRGKIEMYLTFQAEEELASYEVNPSVFKKYFTQLQSLKQDIGFDDQDILNAIIKMPEVIQSKEEKVEEKDAHELQKILANAIDALTEFRIEEGKTLAEDLTSNVSEIVALLTKALTYEDERVEIVRSRLLNNLEESKQKDKIDNDRFEQEMIYYIEKYDISEEKVRLKAHCDYFIKTLKTEKAQGKKLGFISQEIGREINTLGSKANHAEMQRIVVQMKDHLEKIKEQVLNVL